MAVPASRMDQGRNCKRNQFFQLRMDQKIEIEEEVYYVAESEDPDRGSLHPFSRGSAGDVAGKDTGAVSRRNSEHSFNARSRIKGAVSEDLLVLNDSLPPVFDWEVTRISTGRHVEYFHNLTEQQARFMFKRMEDNSKYTYAKIGYRRGSKEQNLLNKAIIAENYHNDPATASRLRSQLKALVNK